MKSPRYDATGDPFVHTPDLFTDRDPKRHAANRRKVANLYSMTTLLRMEEDVDKCVAMLEERFIEFCKYVFTSFFRCGDLVNLECETDQKRLSIWIGGFNATRLMLSVLFQ